MADLDKKIQKAAPDLVQSVLEAQEKRNLERVDMLITNAIKQLKMSRFKPDQATCLGLTYLARINPRIFRQSTVIKDTLKSLLRRDNGPTNIKGKSDIVLPALAANILLACCDSSEVRTMILSKIDQWIGGSSSNGQKAGEMIQHLLATLCMKCRGDQQTINTLIEMRQHWLQYLEDNFSLYGSIPADLCVNIRKLLHTEVNCDRLIGHLNFLIKHDSEIDELGDEMGRFILERPMSLNDMLRQKDSGSELNKMLFKLFIKLFKHLSSSQTPVHKFSPSAQDKVPIIDDPEIEVIPSQTSNQERATSVIVKQEPNIECPVAIKPSAEVKLELKPEVKPVHITGAQPKPDPSTSKEETKRLHPDATTKECMDDDTTELPPAVSYLYIRMPDNPHVIRLNKATLEALLNLVSSQDSTCELEFEELLASWLVSSKSGQKQLANIYEDFELTKRYDMHERLRQKLIHSSNELLVDLGLRDASAIQLISLLQQFGLPLSTIEKINKQLGAINDTELLRSKIEDLSYLNYLLDFYQELGSASSKELQTRLATPVS